MKRLNCIITIFSFVIILSACANNGHDKAKESKKEENQSVDVDKGLLSVKLTIPASMFEGEDIDKVIDEAKKEGIKVTKNNDGSLTYKMSKAKHKEMMKEMKANIAKSVEETKKSDDYTSIKDITYNDNFSEFTLVVDKAKYENSMDGFAAIGLGMSGMMYQLYNGVDPDKYKVTINIKDQATNKVFDTLVYPDDLEDEEKSNTK